MEGTSRESLAAAVERFEERIGSLPEGTGSEEVADGLYAVAALLGREPALRRALTDVSRPAESRQGLVDGLLGQQLSELPLDVVRDLAGRRWNSPSDLLDAVEELAATAALKAAESDGALDDVEDELFRFARLVEREPQLRAALTDASLDEERKRGLLRSLLEGNVHAATLRLVEHAVLVPRRGSSLEDSVEELSRLAAARRRRLVARVRVAQPLDEQQTSRLAAALEQLYGRGVHLQVDVDPRVLGGVQVRVGDEVIDGTSARRLSTVRNRFAG